MSDTERPTVHTAPDGSRWVENGPPRPIEPHEAFWFHAEHASKRVRLPHQWSDGSPRVATTVADFIPLKPADPEPAQEPRIYERNGRRFEVCGSPRSIGWGEWYVDHAGTPMAWPHQYWSPGKWLPLRELDPEPADPDPEPEPENLGIRPTGLKVTRVSGTRVDSEPDFRRKLEQAEVVDKLTKEREREIRRTAEMDLTGSTGEPGAWHGAEPIRELRTRAEAAEAEVERLRGELAWQEGQTEERGRLMYEAEARAEAAEERLRRAVELVRAHTSSQSPWATGYVDEDQEGRPVPDYELWQEDAKQLLVEIDGREP